MPLKKSGFDYVYKGGEILATACFILLCLSVSIQVIARYLFNVTFGWGEEFPIFIFLWVSFIAAAVAYRDRSHLSVDFVVDRFPLKVQKTIFYINLVLSFAFMFILFYFEGRMTISVSHSTFVVIKISKAWCYVGIPLSCLLFMVFIIEKALEGFSRATIDPADE
jgi:TRAP-type C4-dicarboxylate transport system permease small subunit